MNTIKTSALSLLMMFFAFSTSAQNSDTADANTATDKGSWLIAASSNAGLNFSSTYVEFGDEESEKDKNSTFTLNPAAGYFVANDLVVGAQIAYRTSKFTDGDSDFEATSNSISAGPFIRNYFGKGNFRPYVGATILFGSTKSESETLTIGDFDPVIGTSETKTNSTTWGLSAGAALFITENFSIDFDLGYANSTNKADDADDDFKIKSNNFGLNIGFSLFLD